jgi:regulatory protein
LRSKAPDSQEEALGKALRFLGYRPRSEAEVMSYLVRRGYSKAVTEGTLEKLRSFNYLNDESFARDWARSRSEGQGYGPKRIERELGTKGIAETLIRTVVRETFGLGSEAEKARSLLEKNFKNKNLDDPRILRRAAAFLQRHGYSHSVIFDLLRVPIEDD